MSAALVSALLALTPAAAMSQEFAPGAYVTGAPMPNWLGLATPDGRDAIQLGASCHGVEPGVNVLQSHFEGARVTLTVVDPILGVQSTTCPVQQRMHMSDVPCARNPRGVCDVAFS